MKGTIAMHILKSLSDTACSIVQWIQGQTRIIRGQERASFNDRLIAAITLVSIMMVVVFAVKLIQSYSRGSIILATAGEGGEYDRFGENLKNVINNNQKRIRIETIRTDGSCENMQLLNNRREVGLAIIQHDTPTKPSVQAVASLFPEMLHLIADQNIKSIPELKGKRIAVFPNLLGEKGDPNDPNSFFQRFMESYGLKSTVKFMKEQSILSARTAFLSKKVDAILLFIAVGNDTVRDLLTQNNRPANLLPVNVHAIENWHPFVEEGTIYAGAFQGDNPVPSQNIPSASVQALLLTHKEVQTSTIHEITRILYEHRNKFIAENPHAATIMLPNSGENLGIPLHVGAKSYYRREEPGFLIRYADSMALFLSITVLCATGSWHLRKGLQQLQKKRADKYNLEILNLLEQSREIQSLHELQEVRQKLFDIFRRVLEDLDRDRISTESFQLFTFPLEVALGAVRHQEGVLMKLSPLNGDSNRKQD
jgi:TRAP transporter TAXI family solute receptor